MKKQQMITMMGLLAAALLSGCSAELEQGPNAGGIPIDLGYSVVTATDQTRAATDLNDDQLTSGNVAVSVKKHTDGTYPTVKTYNAAAGGALSPEGSGASDKFYYETDGSSSDIIAYYPATVTSTFSVQTNQATDDNYKASDLMWAGISNQLPTSSTINLPFTHKLSKIIVSASAGTGVTNITSVTLNNVKPKVDFTASDGTVTLASSDNAATNITMSNNGAAIIPPQTINGSFITIVTNAGTAVYAVENKEFESGHQYTLNITVNAAAIGATNTITDWDDETPISDNFNPSITQPEAVDLGLYVGGGDGTNGEKKLLFANMNLGASSETDYGDYFMWGHIVGPNGVISEGTTAADGFYFGWSNYKWCNGSDLTQTKYCTYSAYGNGGFTDNKTTLDEADDAAAVMWGDGWRMPTKAELDALVNTYNTNDFGESNTTHWKWEWQSDYNGSGHAGYLISYRENTTDNTTINSTIFLPAAGSRGGTSVGGQGSRGYYWSSSLDEYVPYQAWFLNLNFPVRDVNVSNIYRYDGFSVRAVCEE